MATETKGYQGYANYETWACALWIDNDEGLYMGRRTLSTSAWEENEQDDLDSRSEAARYDLSQSLKAWVEEMAPDLGASMFSDLLGAAIEEIDWHELADTWLNEEINENGDGGYVPA